jgi:UTP:GlnB (protein PII) uridylyltransferase
MCALEDLAERTGQEFPNLLAARDRTERELPAMRDRLRDLEIDADVSVVLFGSWGRKELTEHSDDDWTILVNGPERTDVRPTVEGMRARIGLGERKPGAQDVFGEIVLCDHLV